LAFISPGVIGISHSKYWPACVITTNYRPSSENPHFAFELD
jgi:hypothetical protein